MNRFFASIAGALALAFAIPAVTLASGYGQKEVTPMPTGESGGSIAILTPGNSATVMGGMGIELRYNVTLGPNGNHLHVYVDSNNPIITHDVTRCPCKVPLPDLAPGKHTVAVKEATSGHALTGIEASVSFTVQ